MSGVGTAAFLGGLGVVASVLIVSGSVQPAPPLERVVASLRTRSSHPGTRSPDGRRVTEWTERVHRRWGTRLPTAEQLSLAGRTVEQHLLWSLIASVAGLTVPVAGLAVLQRIGLLGLGWTFPVVGGLAGMLAGPLIVHSLTIERAEEVRTDLRHQLSAYLDVVTMLLAGNTGYESALEQAAHAGDGRLFAELRRRVRDTMARGGSLTEALRSTGSDLGVDELQQIAATAALSASEGAPVARTLSAKCATLRSALASEQESEARLRTSRLTSPIVGMALIFMGLVIYPALSFS